MPVHPWEPILMQITPEARWEVKQTQDLNGYRAVLHFRFLSVYYSLKADSRFFRQVMKRVSGQGAGCTVLRQSPSSACPLLPKLMPYKNEKLLICFACDLKIMPVLQCGSCKKLSKSELCSQIPASHSSFL